MSAAPEIRLSPSIAKILIQQTAKSKRLWIREHTNRAKNGCWEWTGYKNKKGYGQTYIGHDTALAHRVSFSLFKGPIPTGMGVCHKCDNPPCIRPSHLFTGTQKDNKTDSIKKGRHNFGIKSGQAKLNEELVRQVRKIRTESLKRGKVQWGAKDLAKQFGVHEVTLTAAAKGKTWKHLK